MIIAALFIIGFTPTMLWIRNGQVEGVVVGLLTLSGLFLVKSKDGDLFGHFSIIILVSIIFVKPYYAPVLAPALYKKKWLVTGTVTGIVIILLSILLFGVDAYQSYLIIAKNSEHFRAAYEVSKWWAATYRPFYVIGQFRYIIHGGVLIGIILICWFSDKLGILLGSHAPSALTFAVVIPASIILLSDLKRDNDIILIFLSVSLFLFHIHFYVMIFLLSTGEKFLHPAIGLLTPIIPILQPGLYGVILFTIVAIFKLFDNEINSRYISKYF
jgi:hypothetical protein